MKTSRFTSTTAVILLATASTTPAAVLFDGATAAVDMGSLASGWYYGETGDAGGTATPALAGGATVLDTRTPAGSTTIKAGFNLSSGFPFTNPSFQPVPPAGPSGIKFTLRLDDESHDADNDRAGFSVILLSSNSSGIELGFWKDQVWAQQPGFGYSAAEAHPIDTTQTRTYELLFQGGSYTLSEVGVGTLLTGPLRTYSAPGSLPIPPNDVYALQNYLFMGDDTTSAAAKFEIYRVEQVIPEPAATLLFAIAPLLLPRRRR